MDVPEKILKPRPLERWKTPLLENTCLFLLNFYKQSCSEKMSVTIEIDKISFRVTKHQANQVRKYIISLHKIKHLKMNKKGSSQEELLQWRNAGYAL